MWGATNLVSIMTIDILGLFYGPLLNLCHTRPI